MLANNSQGSGIITSKTQNQNTNSGSVHHDNLSSSSRQNQQQTNGSGNKNGSEAPNTTGVINKRKQSRQSNQGFQASEEQVPP